MPSDQLKPLPHWQTTSLTSSTRPQLNFPIEQEIILQTNVGIYQGNCKILNYQKCRAYLTNQRLIFVRDDTQHSEGERLGLLINLKDIKKVEYVKGFIRSSSKIIVYLKRRNKESPEEDSILEDNGSKAVILLDTTWICPICSFVNSINININLNTQEKACENCGVKADKQVLTTVITEALSKTKANSSRQDVTVGEQETDVGCPQCTFINHKSLTNCELCGCQLPSSKMNQSAVSKSLKVERTLKVAFQFEFKDDGLTGKDTKYIKLSFREVKDSSDKKFYQQLQQALEATKWEGLLDNGNINKNSQTAAPLTALHESLKTPVFGIHSLTIKESVKSQQNQNVLTSSVDDFSKIINDDDSQLQSLLDSFTPIVNKQLRESHSKTHKHTITTKQLRTNQYNTPTSQTSPKELAYRIQDHLTSHSSTVITPLTPISDLYVSYNRTLPPQGKISPELFLSIIPMLTSPKSQFQSMVIPGTTQLAITDTKQLQSLQISIINFIKTYGIPDAYSFRRVNLIQVAQFFKWGVGLSQFAMDLAIQDGAIVSDVGLEGTWFYLNEFESLDIISCNNGDDVGFDGQVGDHEESTVGQGLQSDNSPSTQKNSLFDLDFPTVPRAKPVGATTVTTETMGNGQTENSNNKKSKTLLELEGLVL
ncbi:hypothetical protein WICPIJ_002706 [Wickerhamomyces pijperi]|uniref:Vacuolar protein-sorting-associated protein 36 n=1 Tax=Wickerhamomyces pijperi TaxID=599730 RepID=A0A9P8TPL8_WICPI|nr:hypothetical protein WICPIJ_002706 [Wickerhamomyces pijperi]